VSKTFSTVMGALAVAGLALGGIAYASIPDGSGVIHGCYGNSNGQLRVIDDAQQTCKNQETPLDWNAQGPPGPSGLSHAYQASDPNLIGPLSSTPNQILSLSLPPGNYVVVGKTNAFVFQSSVRCALDAGGQVDQTDVQNESAASLSLEATVQLTTATTLSMNCQSTTSGGGVAGVRFSQLVAMAVDALN
jgi:hypothetical protein